MVRKGSQIGAVAGDRFAIQTGSLSNGIAVYGYENRVTPIVVFRLAMAVSTSMDNPVRSGLASLTASGLNRGTTTRTFAEINETTDSAGMAVGAGAGRHATSVSGRCLREDFPLALALAADIARNPVFPDDEVQRLFGQAKTGLRQQDNDTGAVASRQLREMCYPVGHPYRLRPQGSLETVNRLVPEDLRTFHRDSYGPMDATIVVGGDFDFAEVLHEFDRVFGDWTGASPGHVAIPVPPTPQPARRDIVLEGKTQSDVILGIPCIARDHPDFYALRIANLVFGRLGMMGRLGETVREARGLAYGVSSDLDAGPGVGLWTVRAGVNPTNVEAALMGIRDELSRLRNDGITEEEFERAKRFSVGSMALQLETNDGVTGAISDMVMNKLGLDYIDKYPGIVERLTLTHVNEAASRLFPAFDQLVVSVCGPSA